MLLSAILCVITVIIGYYFKAALVIMALLFILLLFFIILKKPSSAISIAIIFPILVSISAINTFNEIEKANSLIGKEANAIFCVTDITYESENYFIADIKIKDSDILNKGDRLSFSYYKNNLTVGDTLKATIKLQKIDNKYRLSSYSNKIFLMANAKDYTLLKGEGNFILKQTDKLRRYIKQTLFSNMGYEQAATMSALTFSEDKYFSAEFKNNVKTAGVSHVMVVSGMHLSVLITLMGFFTEKLFYNRFIKALFILLSVFLMSFLCGFTMSVLRAGVTYILYSVALLLNRKPVGENCLGAAVCLIMLFSPLSIFSLALQLSVLSTFGILAIAIPCCRFITENEFIKAKLVNTFLSAVIVCVSATLMVYPLLIYVYGSISTVGIITTLLISYPVTVAIWITVIALILNPFFDFLAGALLFVCNAIIGYVNYTINKMASLPNALIETPKSMSVVVCVIIILIFCVMLACKKHIDMLKLNKVLEKIKSEGGKSLKWQSSQSKN